MIIDDVKINVCAGSGGKGLATFSRTKMVQGPTGGNGGNGGGVYIEGVSDIGALRQFRSRKVFSADNGENGRSQLNDGANARDLILFVPVGTVCHNLNTGNDIEIIKIGQRELIAEGGKGGRGNFRFRSAINTSPRQFEEGKPGKSFDLHFELKMIADVGFIGFPNVGKSSLLNELTSADSKVANYPFTTLEPNLGTYYDLILADIPGLIEGASTGKGLGIKFLKHVERTKVLFHLVSADSENAVHDYESVRKELEAHNKLLLEKKEYIFISKEDMVSPKTVEKIKSEFKKINKEAIGITILDSEGLKSVKEILNEITKEKQFNS